MIPVERPKTGMKMKDWSLKYTDMTFRAALDCSKPERMAFMPTFMTEPMACIMVLGIPTARMPERSRRRIMKSFGFSRSSGFFRWLKIKPRRAESHWPMTVAMAAPRTPMGLKPR